MQQEHASGSAPGAAFNIRVAGAALFILATAPWFPARVASHFGASGQADGFMSRTAYLALMFVIVVLAPWVTVVIPLRAFRRSDARINLPHREYWLAPERRAETLDYLSRQVVRFSSMLLAFLCYAHWLVLRANASDPPILSTRWFSAGLIVFLVATAIWCIRFVARFRRI